MRKKVMTIRAAVSVLVAASALVIGGSASADNGGRPFSVALSGANEVTATGTPGNPHGAADNGSVTLTLNQGQGEICFTLGPITLVEVNDPPTAGHIHEAPAGVAGPVVVGLFSGTAPTGEMCVSADPELIKEIRQSPQDYYVNLHNIAHPGGAVRGQLAE